eukprot:4182972-Pleurochrysis_carterae.AAC.4
MAEALYNQRFYTKLKKTFIALGQIRRSTPPPSQIAGHLVSLPATQPCTGLEGDGYGSYGTEEINGVNYEDAHGDPQYDNYESDAHGQVARTQEGENTCCEYRRDNKVIPGRHFAEWKESRNKRKTGLKMDMYIVRKAQDGRNLKERKDDNSLDKHPWH